MHLAEISIENFRCFGDGEDKLLLELRPGLNALVGENEAGKTAIVDALRLVLGTADQERFALSDGDFFGQDLTREIRIVCQFDGLTDQDQGAFIEFLSYGAAGQAPKIYLTWTARDTGEIAIGRTRRRTELHSGIDGQGPTLSPEVRELLAVTYLRPLRDAEQALSAGRGSRLSQVLVQQEQIKSGGIGFEAGIPPANLNALNVLGIGDLANELLRTQAGVVQARKEIDQNLSQLSLAGDAATTAIKIGGQKATDDVRLRQLLERLELALEGAGNAGLGFNNLLFMACELLLLEESKVGARILLIEEPEAHLHAQRQLQVMRFLQEQAGTNAIQIIVTTHSPNLASVIQLPNIVLVRAARAFSMLQSETKLMGEDYRFLERFLDSTKANLFFARGVMIVEGDAENILMPVLARLLGRDFTKHGVSIVNVGGVGLSRFARVFQRSNPAGGLIDVPVACVTDMDVMPNCAPEIIGKWKPGDEWPAKSPRQWRAKRDFGNDDAECASALAQRREEIESRASGQFVKTYVADEWTLEYDLAVGPKTIGGSSVVGLALEVYQAARLAAADERLSSGKIDRQSVMASATAQFTQLAQASGPRDGCSADVVLAAGVYAEFAKHGVSKAVAAQYLAEILVAKSDLNPDTWRTCIPAYLVAAIDYVTKNEGTPS